MEETNYTYGMAIPTMEDIEDCAKILNLYENSCKGTDFDGHAQYTRSQNMYTQPSSSPAYYDPMSELDDEPVVAQQTGPKYSVQTVGEGVAQKHNVIDTYTNVVVAHCTLIEAAKKVASLMNTGKMFSDIEVMECIVKDKKFEAKINELRIMQQNPNHDKEKFNTLKAEAKHIKQSI